MRFWLSLAAAAIAAAAATSTADGARSPLAGTYYVSPSGNDKAAGTSPAKAWRTLDAVNRHRFGPGAKILLQGGKTFPGGLVFDRNDRGTAEHPIVVASYGKTRATIASRANGIALRDTAGFLIQSLQIVGPGAGQSGSGSGIAATSDLHSRAKLDGLRISYVEVSGFPDYGVVVDGSKTKSGFRDVRITNVVAHGDVRGGIVVQSEAPASAPGFAHEHVYIGYSKAFDNPGSPGVRKHSGDGILLADVDRGVIERSVAYGNGANSSRRPVGGPVGIWTWNSNRVVIQRNESYANRSGGPDDGGGFDLDGGVTNAVVRHNVSYDNDGPGYLVYEFAGARPNADNVVTDNTSWNDARKNGSGAVWAAGALTRLTVSQNAVFVTARPAGRVAAVSVTQLGKSGPESPSGVSVEGNQLETTGAPVVAVSGRPRGIKFGENVYFSKGAPLRISWNGRSYRSLSSWRAGTGQERAGGKPTGQVSDPKLKAPAGASGATADPAKKTSSSDWQRKYRWLLGGLPVAVALGLLGLLTRRLRAGRRAPSPGFRPTEKGNNVFDVPPGESGQTESAGEPSSTAQTMLERAYESMSEERDRLKARVEDLEIRLARFAEIEPTVEERDRLRAEVEHLRSLSEELRSSYRALVVAGLELLDEQGANGRPGQGAARDRPRLEQP